MRRDFTPILTFPLKRGGTNEKSNFLILENIMAAPVADKIILPLDTGNTGKKKRTQTRVVGADTVHEDFVIVQDPRNVIGTYKASSGLLTVPAAVHNGTTTGFLWVYNPIGATTKMQVSRLMYDMQFVALAVDLLGGELRANMFTFTGTGSGAQITPAKRLSTDAAPQGNVRTASTGLTCTLGAAIVGVQYQTMDLATGGGNVNNPHRVEIKPANEHEETVLLPGEGIVFWHAGAVTAANRRLVINTLWDEFE